MQILRTCGRVKLREKAAKRGWREDLGTETDTPRTSPGRILSLIQSRGPLRHKIGVIGPKVSQNLSRGVGWSSLCLLIRRGALASGQPICPKKDDPETSYRLGVKGQEPSKEQATPTTPPGPISRRSDVAAQVLAQWQLQAWVFVGSVCLLGWFKGKPSVL